MSQTVTQSMHPRDNSGSVEDQLNVNRQVDQILQNDKILMHFPGKSILSSDLYYENVEMNLVETLELNGRYVTSLSSSRFGSTSTATIQNQSLLGYMYLNLTFPAHIFPKDTDTQDITIAANSSWGYCSINQYEIKFQSGASYILSGQGIVDLITAQSGSAARAHEIINVMGGEAFSTAPKTTITAVLQNNTQ